ncbi:MAG: excinuclease ABC subunit UvrA [Mycoplasmoidaceae bacterium]
MKEDKINSKDYIIVKGARENNLKNLDINIPKNQLVVITGLSGSGKSSLAFDTIYAEGQRRYLESLSSYARQFLGGNEKPDVDSIEGLSPAISIEQKTTSNNPRSTVGTTTEIYDYFRLVFARIGKPFCPKGHGEIKTLTIQSIQERIFKNVEGTKLQILAPIIRSEKGTFHNKFKELLHLGYLRVRVNGEYYSLDDEIILEKNKKHDIDIVIDRVIINDDLITKSRVYEGIEKATNEAKGSVCLVIDNEEEVLSLNHSCNKCSFSIPELEPRLFSFNSPIGACSNCNGLGFKYEPDVSKLIPDANLSINDGAIDYFKNTQETSSVDWQKFEALLKHFKIDKNKKIIDFTPEELNHILYESEEKIEIRIRTVSGTLYNAFEHAEGIYSLIQRRHMSTTSELSREYYSKYMSNVQCPICLGKRLSENALCVKLNKKDIIDITEYTIDQCYNFFASLELNKEDAQIINLALNEIISRLSFLQDVGLNYLTLSRTASTLSGGESQRIRLATQIGSSLTGVLYVLDEPSIGLHQKDNNRLIDTLKKMRDLGNTLIVVEHDEDTMRLADYLIDIGPGAGQFGGEIVSHGTPSYVEKDKKSLTGQYLSKKKFIPIPKKNRTGNGKSLILTGASGHNLKNIDLKIPLNKLIAITGVSGSGKSTLINETLVKAIEKEISNPFITPLKYKKIQGIQNIDKVIKISQDPIGRTPRSNPATYVTVFDDIRDIYTNTKLSKERGYKKGRFSFNVKGGRCENCQGDGVKKIEMHFLPDVYIKCVECNGKKYNNETLSVLWKGKSIYDVLEMSVDSAIEFFQSVAQIKRKLQLMQDVGLGYIKLGEQATKLSGGEAQRIKIAKFLQKKATGKTLYVLDEPTTGLHIHDVSLLINVLNRIVDNGDTVIVIEHNLELIKVADYIVDIGPDGGSNGGEVVAEGTLKDIIDNKKSYTGHFLSKII